MNKKTLKTDSYLDKNSNLNKKGMKLVCIMTFLFPFTSVFGSENSAASKSVDSYSGISVSSANLSYNIDSKNISITTESQTRYEGPTKVSDTLWSIADRYLPDGANVNVYQAVGAIYRLNPNAFKDNNIHGLIPGSFLMLPTMEQIAQENTKKIATQLRLDRVTKLEKERQEKEQLAAQLEKKAHLAINSRDNLLNDQPSKKEMVTKDSISPLMALTKALDKNASLSEGGKGAEIKPIKTGLNDYQVATTSGTVLADATQGTPIVTFDIASKVNESIDESALTLPTDIKTLQEKLISSNIEVTRLTENNQLLSNRLLLMEKELAAFKQYIQTDEEVKHEIQEFIEIQRQLNALLNADNRFSLDKLLANSFAFTALALTLAAIIFALIAFFFSRRLKKKEKPASKKVQPVTAPEMNTAEFALADILSPSFCPSPILSCGDKVNTKTSEPVSAIEQVEKDQINLDKENSLTKETAKEAVHERDLETEKEVARATKFHILFDDKHEIERKNDNSVDIIKEPNSFKQVADKQIDEMNIDYVVGLDKDELINLNDMAEFDEEDALQAVLAESAVAGAESAFPEMDNSVLNRDEIKAKPDKTTIPPSSIVVELDELALDKPKTNTKPQNEVSMSVKSDDYQAVLNSVDFNFKENDFNLQMDLAKAYIEMQDFEGAVELLEQVLKSTDPTLQQQAKEMLITLK